MSLYYKEDWVDAQRMLTGWWNHEVDGRWALGIQSPRNNPLEAVSVPGLDSDFKERWLDYKSMHVFKEAEFARTRAC